jgi:hypothetical protein
VGLFLDGLEQPVVNFIAHVARSQSGFGDATAIPLQEQYEQKGGFACFYYTFS